MDAPGVFVPVTPVTLPAPPAGQGLAFSIAQSEASELLGVSFTVVTSAGVANRAARVELRDSTGVPLAAVAAPFVQTATKTSRYTFAPGLQQFGANDAVAIGGPLPAWVIDGRITIAVVIAAIQAADQISDARYIVRAQPVRPE